MELRKRDISVEEILKGAEYLGAGASKEAYLKDGVVYKVPRGRYVIKAAGFGDKIAYPTTIDEVDEFLSEVYDYEEQLVWPLGQFAIELIVWEAIQTLRAEGLEINCFAEIKDYYLDKSGIPVIEQEVAEDYYNLADEESERLWDNFKRELKALEPVLEERFNIELRDVRDGNCGLANGRVKLFDFGISTTTQLDSYDSYSCYDSCWDDCEDEDDCEED